MSGRAAVVVAITLALVGAVGGCNDHVDQQRLAIGNPCNTSGQCGTGKFFCDTSHPNGYCKADCNKDLDCPPGAVCVGAGLILSGACEKTCPDGVSDCRAGDLCTTGAASAPFCAAPVIVDGGGAD
jgi:serine protease